MYRNLSTLLLSTCTCLVNQRYNCARARRCSVTWMAPSCTVHSCLLTHCPFNVLRLFFGFISKCIIALADLTTSQTPSDKRPSPLLRSDHIRRCTERGLEETSFHASIWMVTHFHTLRVVSRTGCWVMEIGTPLILSFISTILPQRHLPYSGSSPWYCPIHCYHLHRLSVESSAPFPPFALWCGITVNEFRIITHL